MFERIVSDVFYSIFFLFIKKIFLILTYKFFKKIIIKLLENIDKMKGQYRPLNPWLHHWTVKIGARREKNRKGGLLLAPKRSQREKRLFWEKTQTAFATDPAKSPKPIHCSLSFLPKKTPSIFIPCSKMRSPEARKNKKARTRLFFFQGRYESNDAVRHWR